MSDLYENNKYIKMAIGRICQTNAVEDKIMLINVLQKRMDEEGEAPTPMVDVNGALDGINPNTIVEGQEFQLGKEMRLRKDTMADPEGGQWFPLFTDMEELHRQPTTNISINCPIRVILEDGLMSDKVKGVVINPFGQSMTLTKEILEILFRNYNQTKGNDEENRRKVLMNKFDELLQLEEALKNDAYGEVKNPLSESIKTHAGTIDDPLPFPHIQYSEVVRKLIRAVYNFVEANPEYNLKDYMGILERNGYKDIKVNTIDVSEMDEKCIMALFVSLVRGERFCDGLILEALESGAVQRWLERLRDIVQDD